MPLCGAAPCQCFSPGGIHTVSPGRSSRTGPPQVWARPTPVITCSVWPSGWVCQAVRAPGSKVTRTTLTRAGSGASSSGSCQTVPVNQSLRARTVAASAADLISMALASLRAEKRPAPSRDTELGRDFEWDVQSRASWDQQYDGTRAADQVELDRTVGVRRLVGFVR